MFNMKSKLVDEVKVYVLVILLQFASAGFGIVAKFALNKGTSHYTLSTYRNAIAAVFFAPFALILERKIRPKMTLTIFIKIILLSLLDPVIGQNVFYAGMNLTTATFTAAMCNILPGITFLIAWMLRVEMVNLKKVRSHAKITGTLISISGAMIMALVAGPKIGFPWTKDQPTTSTSSGTTLLPQNPVKGSILLVASSVCSSLFYILQANTLKSYTAGLSLTVLICTFGALEGVVLTFAVERTNLSVWSIGWNAQLLAYAYGGIVSSGITYFISGVIMKAKGPVFLTAFQPLNMISVALMSSFVFADQLEVGKIAGAIVIVSGLYLVIWGKSKDIHGESYNVEPKLPIHQQASPTNDLNKLDNVTDASHTKSSNY